MVVTVDGGSNMFSATMTATAPWDFSVRPGTTAALSAGASDMDSQPLDVSLRSAATTAGASRTSEDQPKVNNSSNNNKKLRFDVRHEPSTRSMYVTNRVLVRCTSRTEYSFEYSMYVTRASIEFLFGLKWCSACMTCC